MCFTIFTDHESLQWVWRSDRGKVGRWALRLQEFTFRVHYRRGVESAHQVVDFFSRMTTPDPFTDGCIDRAAVPMVGAISKKLQDSSPLWWVKFRLPTLEEIAQEQAEEMCNLHVTGEDLDNKNGVLTDKATGRVYVPTKFRDIGWCSDITTVYYRWYSFCVCGHVGVNRTLATIARKFWWPHMRQDVAENVAQCVLCACLRPHNKTLFAGGSLMAPVPHYMVHMA
eukprot:GHVQ01038414.1.p1 GENE.GHVQ01038414.1~~GHVQ01038414.1.p1  ORF type:complete len:226 (+),score=17.29 GHVQ01038414.1:1055-1732(+)